MNRVNPDNGPLRILHVLRAPLGGLFRHVVDLTNEQIARGHQVGLVTDSTTGGAGAAQRLDALRDRLALGILRLPMRRMPHAGDVSTLWRVNRHLARLKPDVVHGHGAKGGLFARASDVLRTSASVRAYTPHGGSFNYKPGTPSHRVFMGVERFLARGTDLLLFESNYIAGRYDAFVGAYGPLRRTIVNGVSDAEFSPVIPDADAADLLYVGELRSAKGIDTLIDALALAAAARGDAPSLVLVGTGPDEGQLVRQAASRGVAHRIRFAGAMPARNAFRLGRILAVPSRAESLPYVVLEAAAARVPMIATRVGGIPEIFGPHAGRLIGSDDPTALAYEIVSALDASPRKLARDADRLSGFVATRFTISAMADGVLAGYAEARRRKAERRMPAMSIITEAG